MSIPKITKCRECGSTSLTWQTHNKTDSDVQQGRLRTHEVKCLLVLGCDACSETLAVVSADKVATWLTEQGQASLSPNGDATDMVAEQHQGEPVAWLYSRPEGQVEPVVTLNKASAADRGSWDEAPLYTRAHSGEVERLARKCQNADLALKAQTQNCNTLRVQLMEQSALLREVADEWGVGGPGSRQLWDRISTALSASPESSATTTSIQRYDIQGGDGYGVYPNEDAGGEWVRYEDVETHLSSSNASGRPLKISAVALRETMDNLAVKASVADLPPFFLPSAVRQAPLVMLGGVCVRVSYSGLKWYHDQLINDRWEPLTVEEFDALLTEALAKA